MISHSSLVMIGKLPLLIKLIFYVRVNSLLYKMLKMILIFSYKPLYLYLSRRNRLAMLSAKLNLKFYMKFYTSTWSPKS